MNPPFEANLAFSRTIFDSIPHPILVVEDDVRIVDFNEAAAGLFPEGKESVMKKRGGEAFHCINSTKTAEGCGHAEECKSCVIRKSVNQSLSGYKVNRSRHMAQLNINGELKEMELLVTTAPMKSPDKKLVLMILEDVSEITLLRRIIPICANCKRLRNDNQFWSSVEKYFSSQMGVDFTHGICPDCTQKLYPEFANDILPKKE